VAQRGRLEVVDKSSSKFIDGELSKQIDEAEATLGALIAGDFDTKSINLRSLKRAQLALQGKDHPYRLDGEPETGGIWIWEREGQSIFANKRMEKMLGYPPGEITGRRITDFLHEASQKESSALFARLREGIKVQTDVKFRRKDGKGFWTILTATPILDRRGRYLGAFAVIIDISGRKLAENTLQETNELLENIIANTNTAIAYIDREYFFIRVNQAFASSYSKKIADFTGKNFFDIFAFYTYRKIFEQVIITGKPYFEEYQPIETGEPPNQIITFWDKNIQPVREKNGQVIGLILNMVDVTQRFQAEHALQKSRMMFEQLFESAPDSNVLLDQAGTIIGINRQTEVRFGFRRDELIGQPLDSLFPARFHDTDLKAGMLKDLVRSSMPTGLGMDLYGLDKAGLEFPIDMVLNPIQTGDNLLIIAVIRDITRYKTAETALRNQAAYLRLLQDVAVAAYEASSIETAMQFAVDAVCNFIDWPIGHVLMRQGGTGLESYRIWHMIEPDRYEAFRQASETIHFENGVGLSGNVLKSQKPLWWDITDPSIKYPRTKVSLKAGLRSAFSFPVLVGNEVAAVLEFFTTDQIVPDNTLLEMMAQIGTQLGRVVERKRAEKAVQESEARFRTIYEEAGMGIKLIGLDGRILQSNPALQEMLGYTGDELRCMHFTDLTDPADVAQNTVQFDQLVHGGTDHFTLEKRYIHKSGKSVWGLVTMSAVLGEDGKAQFAIGMVENISRRKAVEAELTELQRRLLDSTEAERLRLAQDLHDGPIQDLYGITFRLNDIEAALHGRSSQVRVEDAKADLVQVISTLRYICGEMRPPTLAPFGLAKAIRSHAESFQADHPEIAVKLDLMSDRKTLSEHVRLALYRIYQQLTSNVNRHSQATHLIIRLILDDQHITLEVEDDGHGFNKPRSWIDLAREGHLGLVSASERAQALGGSLEIKSYPGKGTLVRAIVPRSAQ